MALLPSSVSVTSTNRVVALIDMDCFYVQVEERDNPAIKGVPAAVVQYNAYKGGAIIAVNYEARAKGVSRNMRGKEAKDRCPEIQLVRVPETRGKADLTKYRDAGREVIQVLTEFCSCVERASVDEAYIDLSELVENRLAELSSQETTLSWTESILQSLNQKYLSSNYVLGHESTSSWLDAVKASELPSLDDVKLAIGAEIVGKMRAAVYEKTSFRCSAGIAHNKVVAKLVCGINKPNKQTVLPQSSVPSLWSTTKVGKVRGLGGKLGDYLISQLGCDLMSDLGKFSERELVSQLGKTGSWLYQLSLGFDDEPVTSRQLPKSIGCNKNFTGPEALKTKDKVKFWLTQLASEVVERVQRDLETNNRRAKTLTLNVKFEDQNSLSRSLGVHPQYNAERMAADAFAVMEKLYQTLGCLPVTSLGLSASKFEDEVDISGCAKINTFFKADSNGTGHSGKDHQDTNSSTAVNVQKKKIKSNGLITIDSFLCSSSSKESQNTSSFIEEHKIRSLSSQPSSSKQDLDSDFLNSIDTDTKTKELLKSPTRSKILVENEDLSPSKKCFLMSGDSVSPLKSLGKITAFAQTLTHCDEDTVSTKDSHVTGLIERECERCGKNVNFLEYDSHKDYHYAKDLSREINGLPPLSFDLRSDTLQNKEERAEKGSQKRTRGRGASVSTSKRGRGSKAVSNNNPTPTQSNTIDSYFGNPA